MNNKNIQGCVLVLCLVSTSSNAYDDPPAQTAAPDNLPTIFPPSEYFQVVAKNDSATDDAKREQLIERIELLEKKVKTSQKKSQRRLEGLKKNIDHSAQRLQINGFLTAGAVKGEGKLKARKLDLGEDINFRGDSILGLQFNYHLSDSMDAVIHLVGSGRDSFTVEADWAYLSYQINDQLKTRFGRLRIPFNLYSESIAVGFSYP